MSNENFIMKKICCIAALIVLVSCNTKTKSPDGTDNNPDNPVHTGEIYSGLPDQDSTEYNDALLQERFSHDLIDVDALKTYLQKAINDRNSLLSELERTTPLQADSIFHAEKYVITAKPYYEKISLISAPVIDRWMNVIFGDKPDKNDEKVIKLLANSGLEPFYIGEGYMEMRVSPYYYYNIFKPYVSDDTREFMKIWGDNDDLISADAGLVIPLDSLLRRCVTWEKFIDSYPKSRCRDKAMVQYGGYMWLILFSTLDNTPAFSHSEPSVINEWVLESIQEMSGRYPATETDRIIKKYLGELKENDYLYSEELENKIMTTGLLKEWNRESIFY